MPVRKTETLGTDGHYHSYLATWCRDSGKLAASPAGESWGVRNDCNGFFSFHHTRVEAEAAAEEIGADSYAVPVLVFIDTNFYRFLAD